VVHDGAETHEYHKGALPCMFFQIGCNQMNLLCVCPTYGRPPHLLRNTIACFLAQSHKDATLLIFDDLGNIAPAYDGRVCIMSSPQRCGHLPLKYHVMIDTYTRLGHTWDGLVVWDDDDIYLPHHLRAMATGLAVAPWAKPSRVRSTYGLAGGRTFVEDAAGRFHGALAVRGDCFIEMGGWRQTNRATFDQEFITDLAAKYGHPYDTAHEAAPSYVFRWEDTGAPHCSRIMSDPAWYYKHPAAYTARIESIEPGFDPACLAVFRQLGIAPESSTTWET